LSIEQQIAQTLEVIATIDEKQKYLLIEEKQLIEQLENANNTLEDYKKSLQQVETSAAEIQDKLSQFQNEVQADKETREKLVSEITDIKVKISSLEQEKNACLDNIKRIEQELEMADNEIQLGSDNIKALEQRNIDKGNTIETIKQAIAEAKLLQEAKNSKLKEVEQLKKDYTAEAEKNEKTIEEQLSTVSLLEKEMIRIENQKTKLLESREAMYNAIWQEYELTYNTAKQYKSDEWSNQQLQKENRQLKAEIKDLGNINMDAIEEYKVVSERYEFLTTQRNDIVEAEIKLQKIIEDLTRCMSEQFIEQFKLISENFGEVFSELFGGGRAYLQLSDSDNILESGIDIIAQPPGKNLQNMMLLSGGERALTAIALLFAILKLKPSPFCILDEIEAALDDANVNRYADYLRKFSEVTQFIVVTHRKGTMEAADILYGVTMQEQGVSKLVSVKFEEAAV
jgi:chromosome segregation protein